MARYEEKTTCYGSASYVTRVRSRSAKNTFIVDGGYLGADQRGIPLAKLEEVASKVHEYLKTREVICLDRRMGKNPVSA